MQRTVGFVSYNFLPCGLFHNHVAVGAAEAESADSRHSALVRRHPRREFYRDTHRRLLQADIRTQLLEVQMRRDLGMLQSENDFNQAGNSSGGFQMPEIRLR